MVGAFPPISFLPFCLLSPILLNSVILSTNRFRTGFWLGFWASLGAMLVAFYWVIYVIHVFGNLPWAVATLLYAGFCGFGALNLPLFVGLAAEYNRRRPILEQSPGWIQFWFVLGLPALFTTVEFLIPKLFPWYAGHCLYRQLWLVQIVEWTGCTFLSFMVYSAGSTLSLWVLAKKHPQLRLRWTTALVPAGLIVVSILFSFWSFQKGLDSPERTKDFRVALVQANIGSLDKVAARAGVGGRVRYVIDRYKALTEEVLQGEVPNLVVWPETAMPFYLVGSGVYTLEILDAVKLWGVPLITGGYYPFNSAIFRDYNAAYLLDPAAGVLERDVYYKNILLAFGEYFPFGERFPKLYLWFPQVSNFKRGTNQNPFSLRDGTKLGVTICYEAIVPSFYRKVVSNGVQAVVNLTNDSWFGPTSEPYQHAALSVFRAIETRVPLFRVTNTGISFTVDLMGRMSETTPVYAEGVINNVVPIPKEPPLTPYVLFGDWFVIVCILIALSLVFSKHVALLVRSGHRRSSP
ncbi:MAG: apolipoprotein N-acyltransferase [Bdellovibrionales bacterium]|nr:apolipoprotein N-acyltransferase [Bdellovibrionales bacterium]